MRRNVLLVILMLLASCGQEESIRLIPGPKGPAGDNGHSLVSEYLNATEIECDAAGGSRLDIYLDLDDSLSASDGDKLQNSLVICNGSNGLDGAVGDAGAAGHDGPPGPPGSSGPPGLNGNPGRDGIPGPAGLPGQPGAPGSNGSNGLAGTPGTNGSNGTNGTNGTNGANAHTSNQTNMSCSRISDSVYYVKNVTTGNSQVIKIYSSSSCENQSLITMNDANSTFWVSATELAVFVAPSGLRILSYGVN